MTSRIVVVGLFVCGCGQEPAISELKQASTGTMTANSAVRGCIDWNWHHIGYRPDPGSCLDQCIASGADACEWSVEGDCYVEWGANCHVEGGFGGWYAAVAPFNGGGGGTTPSSAVYVGCYADDADRALTAHLGSGHTIESCVNAAANAGLGYAGLQYYGECFASTVLGYEQVADDECNTPCNANGSQICGGSWRNSVYLTGGPAVSDPPSGGPLPETGDPY